MTWLRIDDGFTRHRKVLGLSDKAFRLHVTALCYCAANLTDGEIDQAAMPMLLAEARSQNKHVAELVTAGLWVADLPWRINDYLDFNPSADTVKRTRAQTADRQAKHRASRVTPDTGVTRDVTRDKRVTRNAAVTLSRPVPSPKSTTEVVDLRPRDLLWDAMVVELGDVVTRDERGRRNGVVKQLRDIGATAEEVTERCGAYRREWPSVSLTDTALVKHWSKLDGRALSDRPMTPSEIAVMFDEEVRCDEAGGFAVGGGA